MSFEPDQQSRARPGGRIFFARDEFDAILALYGRGQAAGAWRDYAIDCDGEHVAFALFRRASENPLYRIEKRPALQARQGQWVVTGAAGQVLKRGRVLSGVLDVLERRLIQVVARA